MQQPTHSNLGFRTGKYQTCNLYVVVRGYKLRKECEEHDMNLEAIGPRVHVFGSASLPGQVAYTLDDQA